MISVRDGQNLILAQIASPTPPEICAVPAALGRVLADDLRAPFDVPPSDNSAVDGYAVASADVPAGGTRDLAVVADLPAGAVFDGALAAGEAARIMTGAPMPRGADTVYPQENVERLDARVRVGPIAKGANVRLRGEDIQAGTIVIERGTPLRPQEIGLLASLGLCQVAVHRRPRVALLSTGDEVAEPGAPRRPGQIYDANRFTLRGSIEQCGGAVLDLGIVPDAREALRARLAEASRAADVVVTSGGVSVGVHDLVKDKLAGRRRLFPDTYPATAVEPMTKKAGRREFKRGVLSLNGGRWEVRTTGPQGSGILSSMVAGNCLIVLEEDRGDVAPGETVLVEPF